MHAPLRLILLFLAALPSGAGACDCLPQTAAQEAMKNSTYVMTADVLEKTQISMPDVAPDYKELKIKIRVREYWKGRPERVMHIRTPESVGECGLQLEAGKRYLIYAIGISMPLVTRCSRTVEADSAQATFDLQRLGPGTVPEEE